MKISKQTIDILQNFSKINPSIVVEPGSELETMSPDKSILAWSSIDEIFPQHFEIYDVKEFLRVLTSPAFVSITEDIRDAEIEFGEEYLTLVNGDFSSKYFYAAEGIVVKPKKVGMPEPEIRFSLDKNKLNSVFSMASILEKDDLSITSDGETISVVVLDKKNNTSNDFRVVVGAGNGDTYTIYLKTENIKVLMGSYDVDISSKGISHFSNQEIDLEYWITTEPDSELLTV